jgi:hypothetical protein
MPCLSGCGPADADEQQHALPQTDTHGCGGAAGGRNIGPAWDVHACVGWENLGFFSWSCGLGLSCPTNALSVRLEQIKVVPWQLELLQTAARGYGGTVVRKGWLWQTLTATVMTDG